MALQDNSIRALLLTIVGFFAEAKIPEAAFGKADDRTNSFNRVKSQHLLLEYGWSSPPTKVLLKKQFEDLNYSIPDSRDISCIRPNRGDLEDYTKVFLSHARIYVFAEKYDIKALKMLALHKLHKTLAIYTLFPKRITDIVALLKYVYANTGVLEGSIDDMRALLTHYMGCEMEILISADELKALLKEDGTLLDDFLKIVEGRISR